MTASSSEVKSGGLPCVRGTSSLPESESPVSPGLTLGTKFGLVPDLSLVKLLNKTL